MYKLTVITPEKTVFDEEVYSLIANGGLGYLEILTNHCSILSTLQPGKLIITRPNGERLLFAVSGGFLEVSNNIVTILADAIESPNEINLERAQAAAQRAEELLKAPEDRIDIPRAKAALLRAKNRISIYHQVHDSRQPLENFKV